MTDADFEKYKLGSPNIDRQHRELLDSAQTLLELYKSVYDKAIMVEGVQKFKKLVEDHFDYEEALMISSEYCIREVTDYDTHIIVSEINGFLLRQKVEFNEEFPIKYLSKILVQHILGCDIRFVTWLNR